MLAVRYESHLKKKVSGLTSSCTSSLTHDPVLCGGEEDVVGGFIEYKKTAVTIGGHEMVEQAGKRAHTKVDHHLMEDQLIVGGDGMNGDHETMVAGKEEKKKGRAYTWGFAAGFKIGGGGAASEASRRALTVGRLGPARAVALQPLPTWITKDVSELLITRAPTGH